MSLYVCIPESNPAIILISISNIRDLNNIFDNTITTSISPFQICKKEYYDDVKAVNCFDSHI